MRVHLGGRERRVIKQEAEEVSIPPHLMTESSHVSVFYDEVYSNSAVEIFLIFLSHISYIM